MSSRPDAAHETLAVIDAPHFYAGIVLRNDSVVEAADIVRYMRGWSRDDVRSYCARKGWKVSAGARTVELAGCSTEQLQESA